MTIHRPRPQRPPYIRLTRRQRIGFSIVWLLTFVALVMFAQVACQAQTLDALLTDAPLHPPHVYLYSAAFLAAGTTADILSSRGLYETDPLLGRGQFGARQATIRIAGVGVSLGVQYLILRKHPEWSRRLTWLNIASGGLAFGAAGHNYTLRR